MDSAYFMCLIIIGKLYLIIYNNIIIYNTLFNVLYKILIVLQVLIKLYRPLLSGVAPVSIDIVVVIIDVVVFGNNNCLLFCKCKNFLKYLSFINISSLLHSSVI